MAHELSSFTSALSATKDRALRVALMLLICFLSAVTEFSLLCCVFVVVPQSGSVTNLNWLFLFVDMSKEVVADESQQVTVRFQALPFGSAFVPQKCLWPLKHDFCTSSCRALPYGSESKCTLLLSLFHFFNLAWILFYILFF